MLANIVIERLLMLERAIDIAFYTFKSAGKTIDLFNLNILGTMDRQCSRVA